jgi:hypothetical protein
LTNESSPLGTGSQGRNDAVRRTAVIALFISVGAIALGYAVAFRKTGPPAWSPWLVAIAVPISIVAIMVLGAARGGVGIGRLRIPFALVALILILGFIGALAAPATESAVSRLWLGLPLRAAIVIYGIGLLPIIVLPVAYALTFETQTLNAGDVERVRELGRARASSKEGTLRADARGAGAGA